MLFLALRQLFSRKRQTILTLLGIVLGTAAYVAISGMMLGFQTYIVDQLVNNDAYIRITAREEMIGPQSLDRVFFPAPPDGVPELVRWRVAPSGRRDNARIEYPQGWFERLDADPRVVGYSQQIVLQGIATRGKISRTVRLVGMNPERQSRITNIDKYMVRGAFRDVGQSGNRVILGRGLSEKLGAHVGESVLLSVGKSEPLAYKIVGIFSLGISAIDDVLIYGSLGDFQKLNLTPSQVTDIAVRLNSASGAAELANQWSKLAPDKVQSWDQANASILSVFTTQDVIRNFMTISILIVAGFGIYNILNMLVNQKRKEIGILRSMGFEPSDVVRLFLIQGVFLGVVGGVVGMIMGYLACRGIATIRVDPGRLGGGTMMMNYDVVIYVKAFFLAFGAALFAAFWPARAAGRMNPIEIIRSEGA